MDQTIFHTDILKGLGTFSSAEYQWFTQHLQWKSLAKGEVLHQAGKVCTEAYFIQEGACYQAKDDDGEERVIDLHLKGEWLFPQASLLTGSPSTESVKAFLPTTVAVLGLKQLHTLMDLSTNFFQLGRLFNQGALRTELYDGTMDPDQKYALLLDKKPGITQVFPIKMIASYLKVTPETISRVRARLRNS